MNKTTYQILRSQTGVTYQIPVVLETNVDEFGVMVGFDGDIYQVDEFCNFSYTQTGNTIQVYNTVNIESFRKNNEAVFKIYWGDGTSSDISVHTGNTLSTVSKTYSTNGTYEIKITLESIWTKQELSKIVTIPMFTNVPNPLGTYNNFVIPYSNVFGWVDYLNDLDYSNNTGYTVFNHISIGGSRIIEKKLYGSNTYTGLYFGTYNGVNFTGYTIDNLDFKDLSDGYTIITGSTSGFTKEEVFNNMITRNEHFLGFIDEPTIYSDIFVERGKLSAMERNLRLSEIDNIGELEIYGNGYYNIENQ